MLACQFECAAGLMFDGREGRDEDGSRESWTWVVHAIQKTMICSPTGDGVSEYDWSCCEEGWLQRLDSQWISSVRCQDILRCRS